ncbi:MAG: FecCD family ABC transporter permease [Gammaproteobacteria bacterium]
MSGTIGAIDNDQSESGAGVNRDGTGEARLPGAGRRREEHSGADKRGRRLLTVAVLVLALAFVAALLLGPANLASPGTGALAEAAREWRIVATIRLPRALAALLVGASDVLAGSGASLQTVFRNPLAAPDILGLSSGAALGAALAILFGWSGWALQAVAFGGALTAVALVAGFARAMRSTEPTTSLILCGIAVAALLSAALALLTALADPSRQLPAITYWLLGSLAVAPSRELAVSAALIAAGLFWLWLVRWQVDALLLPDDEAAALGHDPVRLRAIAIGAAALAASAAVSLTGLIGWVGLLVPHAARLLTGAAFARSFPLACVGGAAFLLVVDTTARVLAPIEVPPAVGTALVGVPLLLWLLGRSPASGTGGGKRGRPGRRGRAGGGGGQP